MKTWKWPSLPQWKQWFKKYQYVLLTVAVGILLLLLPSGTQGEEPAPTAAVATTADSFDLTEFELRLADTLSQISGVGTAQVLLTLATGEGSVLAQDTTGDTTTTVTVTGVERDTQVVELQRTTPEFQGALIVCPGGDSPTIQLQVVSAVSALTGLGANRITVCKSSE